MGITKDPAAIDDQEDDNEVSSCVEDELLGQVHLGPMPMKQYLELQLSMLGKPCSRNRPQAVAAIVGFAALLALAVWGTTALRQSAPPATPPAPPPATPEQLAAEQAQMQQALAGSLGANFKSADYTTDHSHPEQWLSHMQHPKTFLQPHHLSPAVHPQYPSAAPQQAAAERAQLQHELAGSLGANFEAADYTTDHNDPEQWLRHMQRPKPILRPPQGADRQPPAASPAPAQPDASACDYKRSVTCSARSLFHSAEIHRVVTDNLVRTSSRLLSQADYAMVNEFAWMGFKKINEELAARAPDVAQSLEAVHLKQEQMHAVLDVMALLSDVSVEGLGYSIAKIIRTSTFATKKYLKLSIEDALEPIDDIRQLASGLLPASVVEAWKATGHDDWELTLDPENVHSMRVDTIKPNATGAGMDFKTKSLSVYAGVLQQGKVLLEIMRTYIVAEGPSWSRGAHDAVALLLSGITPPTEKDKLDWMETFLWPLKCASQGIDALRVSLCPRFGGSPGGHGKEHDLAGDIGTLGNSVHREIGDRIKKSAAGLNALRAEFKR